MKKIAFLLFISCSLTILAQKETTVKVFFNSTSQLNAIVKTGADLHYAHEINDKYFIADYSTQTINKLINSGYTVEFLTNYKVPTYKMSMASQFTACIDEIEYPTPENFSLGSINGHLSYQELLEELDKMHTLYPNLITQKSDIGNFLTEGEPDNAVTPPIGGNGIKWIKISDNPNQTNEGEPQVLFISLVHGREAITLTQLVYFMWYVLDNYDNDPLIKSIVDVTELYFVPVVNPDGYLYNQKIEPNGGGTWRKNRKSNGDGSFGVDLNRNYDYYINGDPNNNTWGGEGTSNDPSADNYHGTGPFSEIETQAIKYFVETHNFTLALDHHATGGNLLYPFGYSFTAPSPEEDVFQTIGASLTSQNNYEVQRFLYANSGVAGSGDDFFYGTVNTHNKIYAMSTEVSFNMYPPIGVLEEECQKVMHLNIVGAQLVNEKATLKEISPYYLGSDTNQAATAQIQRIGLNGDGNFTISINPITTNIENIEPPLVINDLDLLEENISTISYDISTDTEIGDAVIYELIVDNGIYPEKILVEKRFGNTVTILFDTADDINENFINDGFGVTTEDAFSPPGSFTDSPNSNYGINETKTLTLRQKLDLTNAKSAQVSFYCKWDLEKYFDFVQFQISEDEGNTWVSQCGILTNTDETTALDFTPKYDGVQLSWMREEIILDDYLGKTIEMRFLFDSDPFVDNADGFYLDDFKIRTIGGSLLNTTTVSHDAFTVYPNPVSSVLNIVCTQEDFKIEVYTIQGQLIFEKADNTSNSTVDYTNFANGIYLMRLTSEGTTQTVKIVKK